MFRKIPKLLVTSLLVLGASSAFGQKPRDAAATKKIDEAINEHYLATDFQKAEDILLGTIKACEDKCSNGVLARAWMYVGLVRLVAKNDSAGARDAFQKALDLDPKVKFDNELATPAARDVWAEMSGGATSPGGSGGGGGGGGGKKPPKGEDEVGSMNCTPTFREVQTRYPLQIHCETEEDATKAELRYKAPNADDWKSLTMKKKGDGFQAEIPCADLQQVGEVRIFVRAKDSSGDTVDSWGSRSKPIVFKVSNEEQDEVASFPDKDPPARCKEKEECPPDLPGCGARGDKSWGDSCASTNECKAGLSCVNGQCEQGAPCDTDAECGEGASCVEGSCSGGDGGGPSGPAKKVWMGFHLAQDLAFISGDAVCSQQSQANDGFACFLSDDTQYQGTPRVGAANSISGGAAPGTLRLLVSGGYRLTDNILLGGRLGYAFGGGPEAGGTAFLPFHVEVRGEYWIGDKIFAKPGLRPYVGLGGGVAQVDAALKVSVVDCPGGDDSCVNGTNGGTPLKLTAYKKLGQSFAALSGGAMWAFNANGGLILNLNLMYMLPTTGMVLEPSLGYQLGF